MGSENLVILSDSLFMKDFFCSVSFSERLKAKTMISGGPIRELVISGVISVFRQQVSSLAEC